MKYISFAWTTAALKARRKNVTRREWDDDYAARFYKGEIITATDKQKRFGGKEIGTLRLTVKPYKESEAKMPDSDYEGEGYAFFDEYPSLKPKGWQGVNMRAKFETDRRAGAVVWVVRFEIVSLAWEQEALALNWGLL